MNAFSYSNMPMSKGGNCSDRQLPPRNCHAVKVSVWVSVRISFGVGGQFSSGTTVLELSKELRFVFIKIWWKYEIDHFPIRIFRRCHNYQKIYT